jgi:hypothetical protein
MSAIIMMMDESISDHEIERRRRVDILSKGLDYLFAFVAWRPLTAALRIRMSIQFHAVLPTR